MTAWAENKKIYNSKNVLLHFWDGFIHGGHLIAIGLACVVLLAAVLMEIKITFEFLVVVYLLSVGPCLFGRYIDLKADALTNPKRSEYLSKKAKTIPFLISLCVIILLSILVYNNKFNIIIFGIGMVLLSFLYDLYFKNVTKVITGFKNIYIGVLFSLLIVMMVLYYDAKFDLSFLLVITYIFLMILSGSAFSDIKDMDGDRKDGLKTFAIAMGHKNVIRFLTAITALALAPIFVGVSIGVLPIYSLMLVLGLFYRIFLFRMSFVKGVDSNYLYAVLFDGELTLWVVFVLSGRVFL